MKQRSIPLLLLILVLGSCGNRNKEALPVSYEEPGLDELVISDEAMNEVIENIASPIEMASLLNELDIPFSTSYLADPDKMSSYATNYEMAYYLGALSSDLGYLNMYNKTRSAINYLGTINKLAEALDIGQFFDFVKMKRLATGQNTLDSLLFVSMKSYNQMDDHLKATGRSNLSTLMVCGVWMEGLYLATQVQKKAAVAEIRETIGQQKLILSDLLIIMEKYKSDPYFADLIEDFYRLKVPFDDVKITYEIGEPKSVEVDGMLMVIQDESSKIEIPDATLSEIVKLTEEIRNKHLNI